MGVNTFATHCILFLLYSFVAVLPAELENVPDDFLHQLKGLLDLGLNQWGEVNYSHVHLNTHTHKHKQQEVSMDLQTQLQSVCTGECIKKVARKNRYV